MFDICVGSSGACDCFIMLSLLVRECIQMPKMADIYAAIPEEYKSALSKYTKTKPVRTASGVRRDTAVDC